MKESFVKRPFYHIDAASVQALLLQTFRARRAMAMKGLGAGQLNEFVKMAGITWLELCHILRIDVVHWAETCFGFYQDEERKTAFLDMLVIYGMGYAATGNPALFNRWMRREQVYMGFMSPISMLDTHIGRRMVRLWVKEGNWMGTVENSRVPLGTFMDGELEELLVLG